MRRSTSVAGLLALAISVAVFVACSQYHAGQPCNEGEVSGLTGCTPKGETRAQKYAWETVKISYNPSDVIGCTPKGSKYWGEGSPLLTNYREIAYNMGGNAAVVHTDKYETHEGIKTVDHFTNTLYAYDCPATPTGTDPASKIRIGTMGEVGDCRNLGSLEAPENEFKTAVVRLGGNVAVLTDSKEVNGVKTQYGRAYYLGNASM
jgi:hypothetical protein